MTNEEQKHQNNLIEENETSAIQTTQTGSGQESNSQLRLDPDSLRVWAETWLRAVERIMLQIFIVGMMIKELIEVVWK